jgi:transcriptional regulator of heat shock response
MDDRTKKIFKISVQEYIKSAKPVASKELREKYELDLSPATIRHELFELENDGYLYQPHTSAGRIPTNKGYRYFIDEMLGDGGPSFGIFSNIERQMEQISAQDEFFGSVADILSRESGVLGIAGSLDSGRVAKSGIKKLFTQPDFSSTDDFLQMGETIEKIEKNFFDFAESFFSDHQDEPRVFIGDENPFSAAENFSFMATCCEPKKEKSMMLIMGPKRMEYRKNYKVLKGLKKFMNEY